MKNLTRLLLGSLCCIVSTMMLRADNTSPIIITPATLPAVATGTPFTVAFAASGGTAPYTFSVLSGAPPPGLTFNATNTALSGTPTKAGSYVVFIHVTDSPGVATQHGYSFSIAQGSGGGTTTPPATYSVTVTNGSASTGSAQPGATVTLTANAAPAGQYFKQWSCNAPVASSFAASTTFTMPASNVTVAAQYYTPQPVPQPVATHPRLWLTPTSVQNLRLWAVSSNPLYANVMLPILNTAINDYNTKFFPNGQPNAVWPDFGDSQGYAGLLTEQYALVFAFFSQIDPVPANRILHAQRARNLLMYALNAADGPHDPSLPFRDPNMVIYNRGNFTGEAWGLALDWIYNATDASGSNILTAQDKRVARDVFMIWANDCLNANTTGGDHPGPVGTVNSPFLLPGGNAYRMAANNYYLGHARLLTLMSLAIDPADDPVVTPGSASSMLGNTLRSYIPDATGAWLYQEYAMFGDPQSVVADYGLSPAAKVGVASGGLPPEGMLYGHSFSYLFGQLLALKTAGFADTTLSGPQAKLGTANFIDRFCTGFTSSLAPAAQVVPGYSYLGPVYKMLAYGDVLRIWVTPDFTQTFALLGLLDQSNGSAAHASASSWFITNACEGGSSALYSRLTNTSTWGVQNGMLAFMFMDPKAAPAADPRPNLPLTFTDPQAGRLIARSNWGGNSSVFDFLGSWITINHQSAACGEFELYRNGEPLTKELSNYDSNMYGQSSMWHNTLTLQNYCTNGTPALSWFESPLWTNGSQFVLGMSNGDPVTTTSTGAGYAFANTDMTNLYNRPDHYTPGNNAVDITQASRSVLWLNNDDVVLYDRATSQHSGLFKRFNLNFVNAPVLNGRTATETTPGGQKLFVQSLLPANATMNVQTPAGTISYVAQMETTTCRLVVEDPAKPSDTRFLHILEGGNGNATLVPATLIQSTSGTAFDGTVFGSSLVMFANNLSTLFTSTTYTAPPTATTHYVTGLTPNAGYNIISQDDAAGNVQVTVMPGGPFTADAAGVLVFLP